MTELTISKRSEWFKQARNAVAPKSRAAIAIEELLVNRFGNEAGFQEAFSSRPADQEFRTGVWESLEEYWKV